MDLIHFLVIILIVNIGLIVSISKKCYYTNKKPKAEHKLWT